MDKLPIEIIQYLFKFVKNTSSYKNLRLTCKTFYFLLRDIKVFDNYGNILYTYNFNINFIPQTLLTINNKNNEKIGEITFDSGGFKKKIKNTKITLSGNNLTYRKMDRYNIYSRKYNISTKYQHEETISLCSIM